MQTPTFTTQQLHEEAIYLSNTLWGTTADEWADIAASFNDTTFQHLLWDVCAAEIGHVDANILPQVFDLLNR